MDTQPQKRTKSSLHLWSYLGLRSQVWLYRLLGRMQTYPPHLLLRREWIAGRDLSEFPWPPERLHFFPARSRAARFLSKIGPWLRSGNRNALTSLDARFVCQLCRLENAVLIHIHFGWLACDILSAHPRLGAPVVVSLYGSDVFRTAGRQAYVRRLDRLLQSGCPFIVESNMLEEELVRRGAAPAGVHVVPVGISADELPGEEETIRHRRSRVDAKPIRLITVGRLVDYKAPQQLPDVARMLKDRGLPFEWHVVGDGPLMEEVCRRRDAMGVGDCFHVRGALSFRELADLRWNSDILVHNAVIAPDGGRECLGVALLEAQAVGIPVVSCRVGGIPEAVADGKTGFLVAEGDLTGMAERIAFFHENRTLCHEMGMAGMRRTRSEFDSVRLAARLQGVYDHILSL